MGSRQKVLWPCDRGTRAKLEILSGYLGAWFNILAHQGIKDVVYFDGFCGAGEHEGGEHGSPVIAAQLASAAAQRVDGFNVHMICVDNREESLRHLKSLKAIRKPHPRVSIDIRFGHFDSEIREIIADERYSERWPIFSFIDPFGFSDFSRKTLDLLMRNNSSEIFINLMCGYMNRFNDHYNEKVRSHVLALIGEENIERVSNSGDGINSICDVFNENLEELAPYVRRFMMRDQNNTRDNALFFCSRNKKGLQKIKEAMWKVDPINGASFSEYIAEKDESDLFRPKIEGPQTARLRKLLLENFKQSRCISVQQLEEWIITETDTYLPTHLKRELEVLFETRQISYEDPAPTGRRRQKGHWPERLLVTFGNK